MEPKYLAEGWAYWRSASGYMSTFNATAVEAVDALFDLNLATVPESTACSVKTLVESLCFGDVFRLLKRLFSSFSLVVPFVSCPSLDV